MKQKVLATSNGRMALKEIGQTILTLIKMAEQCFQFIYIGEWLASCSYHSTPC